MKVQQLGSAAWTFELPMDGFQRADYQVVLGLLEGFAYEGIREYGRRCELISKVKL